MQLLIFWIGTIVTKFILDEIFVVMLMKEMAKEGYYLSELKIDKISESRRKNTDNNQEIIDKIIPFIPIINIFDSLEFVAFKQELLNELDSLDLVKKMSEEERKEYEKNPTISTIFKITMGDLRKENIFHEKKQESSFVDYNELSSVGEKRLGQDKIDQLYEMVHKLLVGEISYDDLNDLTYFEKKYILEEAKRQAEEELKIKKAKIKK